MAKFAIHSVHVCVYIYFFSSSYVLSFLKIHIQMGLELYFGVKPKRHDSYTCYLGQSASQLNDSYFPVNCHSAGKY